MNDLQADVEAGSRYLRQIDETAAAVGDSIAKKTLRQTTLLRSLLERVTDLKACVLQQRATLRDLRHDIRRMRTMTERT